MRSGTPLLWKRSKWGMQVLLTFVFPETGDNHPDVMLYPADLLLIPNVGDEIAVGSFFGKTAVRTVIKRTFSFRQETRIVMLTCR